MDCHSEHALAHDVVFNLSTGSPPLLLPRKTHLLLVRGGSESNMMSKISATPFETLSLFLPWDLSSFSNGSLIFCFHNLVLGEFKLNFRA